MRLIFESCIPRSEVLSDALQEDIFAARIKDVVEGSADPVYGHPVTFFNNTYPTAGLRTLLAEALGRLTGAKANSNPILRLETAFGGGKTHNLIALYHAARGQADASMLGDILPSEEYIPAPGAVDVAVVVGNDLSPTDGLLHSDGTRTYTLWGELAYQLGKRAGYAVARESDLAKSAPGTGLFEELIGNRPTLIMIDEIARHMRVAQGVPTTTGKSDLAEQTVAFLMALLEFAASRSNVVVVLTLADIGDAFSGETERLQQQLGEARRITARQEMVITPTGESELPAIVTHRLFERIDAEAAQATAEAYLDAYKQWFEQSVELPQHAVRAEYAASISQGYPFHPELLNVLNLKVSTIPNFQKTRGALRLLATVVRELWLNRPTDAYLIHPHHVALAQPEIASDLTSRLQRPAFQQVIEADIVSGKLGSESHADVIDATHRDSGKPDYARRVATTVLLHSLSQGIATGLTPAELRLAVLQPETEPFLVNKAAERLNESGWFFEWDGNRYRFKTEPSLNKIVSDEAGMIGRLRAKGELEGRIRLMWKSGTFKPLFFPEEPIDIEDDAGTPKLAIIGFDTALVEGNAPEPPELARRLFDRAGAQASFRRYQNNVLFLVADRDQVEPMVEVAQRYLAIHRILDDGERVRAFAEEQRTKLKKMGEAAELDVRVAISRAYRHLFFPQAAAPKAQSHLEHVSLPIQEQGEVRKDQSDVILRVLKAHQKALTSDDAMLSAPFVKSRAWNKGEERITTEELRRRFARNMGLRMLFDLNQLKRTVKNGIENRIWIYYDAAAQLGFDHDSPPPAIQISEDVTLYTPEEAQRREIPIKGKRPVRPIIDPGVELAICPICGNPEEECTCGAVVAMRAPLHGEGTPQKAIQQLLDACHDGKVDVLSMLTVTLRGDQREGANNLRTLGLVLPQLGKGDYRIKLNLVAEFAAGEWLNVSAQLGDALYKRLRQVTDALAQEATDLKVEFILEARYAEGLALDSDTFRTLHELLTSVGLGRIDLRAEAHSA